MAFDSFRRGGGGGIEDGAVLSHGANAKLIGKNLMGLKDVDGKLFIADLVKEAKAKDNGWIEYKWENPVNKKVETKSVYYEKKGDWHIAKPYYDQYLLEKEEALRVEELQNAEFDRKLAQEEVWIRQGIKARRTRNEGRVRALKAMRRERGERREVMGTAKMQVEEALSYLYKEEQNKFLLKFLNLLKTE